MSPFLGATSSFQKIRISLTKCPHLAQNPPICGLYYKHEDHNDNYNTVSKWSSKVFDDSRVIIYNRNMSIQVNSLSTQIKLNVRQYPI